MKYGNINFVLDYGTPEVPTHFLLPLFKQFNLGKRCLHPTDNDNTTAGDRGKFIKRSHKFP